MLLLGNITDFLETRRSSGVRTTLHKIRAHTIIQDNDLANVAARLAVTDFGTLRLTHTIRVDIGEIASRPAHRVMYTTRSMVQTRLFLLEPNAQPSADLGGSS